ncbi:hypothetical protein SELMODRAFT_129237, partial [Selaginella moellendorffii]
PIVSREQPKSQWDDEDKEEEAQVKESWEDEEEKPVSLFAPAPKPPKAEKAEKAEKTDKKGKKSVPAAPQEQKPEEQAPSDPLAEKLKQQRLVEEADYQVTTELFGKESRGRPFEGFLPKSEADFIEYADLVARELKNYETSYHYMTMLKTLLKTATASMKAADVKEVASAVTVIANEKLKAEKDSAGKKKGAKKKQLHVDKADEDNYSTAYDDVDEFDFM